MTRHKESLAQLMTREMGKTLSETRGDVQEGIDTAYLMSGESRKLLGETAQSELPNKYAISMRMPVGVCGLITPWNFPIAIPTWKMFPALVAGNTIILKTAPDTPASAVRLFEIMLEAGFPPGVLNLVHGDGVHAGQSLVEHPDVDVISFTGSSATGRKIAEICGRT